MPVTATYKAKTFCASHIEIKCEDLPGKLNQLIVWCMTKPDEALHLLPEYEKLRQQATERDEGSAKNHGIEV